ncbi:hypothetical protein BSKO_09736 [Bryopsis sp. KO-2023]|nr:hypothetical protein BSKO_09736 [Bryopsis sp. KO-2023]
MEAYTSFKKIGEGSYGEVFRAHDASGKAVAVKICRFKNADGVPAVALREVSLLQKLSRCENIVRLHAVHPSREQDDLVLHLVLECLDRDLKQHLDMSTCSLPPYQVKLIVHQVLKAVQYCHERGIFHRDIKPQNILLSGGATPIVKLADFGLARPYSIEKNTYTHEVLTLWYRPPEILLGDDQYTSAVDIWSIGCILAEIISRKPLFPGICEVDQLMKIFAGRGTPNHSNWEGIENLKNWHEYPRWNPAPMQSLLGDVDLELLNLVEKMLIVNPKMRISAREALRHPYFNEMRALSSLSLNGQTQALDIGARRFRKARRDMK